MNSTKCCALVLENFEGYDNIIYFINYNIAKQNFDVLCEKYKNYEEFEKEETECSWFDADYNEYSTHVWLKESTLNIFSKVIF